MASTGSVRPGNGVNEHLGEPLRQGVGTGLTTDPTSASLVSPWSLRGRMHRSHVFLIRTSLVGARSSLEQERAYACRIPTDLYRSIRGTVLCREHMSDIDHDGWRDERWVPSNRCLGRMPDQCQHCATNGLTPTRTGVL